MSLEAGKFYVGHLGRVPIFVALEALILLVFVWNMTPPDAPLVVYLLSVTALLLTILLHELGHALVAVATGMDGVSVTIGALGGYCEYKGDRTPRRLLPIALAGVAVNFLLWWLCRLLLPAIERSLAGVHGGGLVVAFIELFMFWNLISGVFNVLPIYPLDGGNAVLRASQMIARHDSTARRFTLALTVATAIAALIYFGRGGHIPTWNLMLVAVLVLQAFRDLR